MSKEEFLKIQTCVLKVNIHCDGCKQKVKKILQKIDGVFTIKIDSDTGKVTVSGNADPNLLIKKLIKAGKHAELWGSQKPNNNNQNHLNLTNQFKNMHLDGNKGGGGGGGGNNKGQKGGGGGGNNQQQHPNQPKGGPQGLTPQQLQQLQHQMKGFQDLKLPQFNNLKMPFKDQPPISGGGKPGAMSFHDDDDFDDDDFDDEYDDDDEFDDDDDDFDDDMDEVHHPVNKMKTGMGNGPGPTMMMPGMMKVVNGGSGGGNSGKKGGGATPVQIAGGNNGNGKKGGGGGGGSSGGNHQNQGGGGGKNGGSKNGGMPSSGGMPEKNGNHGGGGPLVNGIGGKNGGVGNNGGGASFMENGFPQMGGNLKMPMGGQMGNLPMNQMGNLHAVNGLPAASMAGVGGSDAYYRGSGPDVIPGNPYQQQQQQQQYLAAVMNQQRAMGNDRFQPMMYARPPPAVNYMQAPAPYPYPQYPYPYPQQGGDPYSYYFSEENPSSCNVM